MNGTHSEEERVLHEPLNRLEQVADQRKPSTFRKGALSPYKITKIASRVRGELFDHLRDSLESDQVRLMSLQSWHEWHQCCCHPKHNRIVSRR